MKKLSKILLLAVMLLGMTAITFYPVHASEVHSGYTVYSHDSQFTLFEWGTPISTDLNDYIVFINGELVFEFGNQIDDEYIITNGSGTYYMMITHPNDADSWSFTNEISNNLEVCVVVIIATDHESVAYWGLMYNATSHSITGLDANHTSVYVDGISFAESGILTANSEGNFIDFDYSQTGYYLYLGNSSYDMLALLPGGSIEFIEPHGYVIIEEQITDRTNGIEGITAIFDDGSVNHNLLTENLSVSFGIPNFELVDDGDRVYLKEQSESTYYFSLEYLLSTDYQWNLMYDPAIYEYAAIVSPDQNKFHYTGYNQIIMNFYTSAMELDMNGPTYYDFDFGNELISIYFAKIVDRTHGIEGITLDNLKDTSDQTEGLINDYMIYAISNPGWNPDSNGQLGFELYDAGDRVYLRQYGVDNDYLYFYDLYDQLLSFTYDETLYSKMVINYIDPDTSNTDYEFIKALPTSYMTYQTATLAWDDVDGDSFFGDDPEIAYIYFEKIATAEPVVLSDTTITIGGTYNNWTWSATPDTTTAFDYIYNNHSLISTIDIISFSNVTQVAYSGKTVDRIEFVVIHNNEFNEIYLESDGTASVNQGNLVLYSGDEFKINFEVTEIPPFEIAKTITFGGTYPNYSWNSTPDSAVAYDFIYNNIESISTIDIISFDNVTQVSYSGKTVDHIEFVVIHNNEYNVIFLERDGTATVDEGNLIISSGDTFKINFEVFEDASPVINGEQYVTVSYLAPTTETLIRANIYAWDEVDGDITSSITLVSDNYTPNKSTIGTYQITYSVSDSSSNEATLTVYVIVVDSVAPVFTGGQSTYTIGYDQVLNLTTTLSAITATDAYDGVVSFVVTSNTYTGHESTIGSYEIVLTATDSSGNEATRTLNVNVVDNVTPVISGPVSITVDYNTPITINQILEQMTATDVIDGDLTADIEIISSTFNGTSFAVVGVYTIVFGVDDSNTNHAQYIVTVTVRDLVPPVWFVTDGFLITLDEAVSLSTAQILNIMQLAGLVDSDTATAMYLVSEDYYGSTELGMYNVIFGYMDGEEEVLTTVSLNVVSITELAEIYTVIFDSNGGTYVGSISTNGGVIIQPTNPTKTGYTFSGWYSNEELTTVFNFTTTEITADTILYAKWVVVDDGTVIPTEPTELNPTLQFFLDYWYIGPVGLIAIYLLFVKKYKR
jgi:uncharacterized repeat protein (TIGR02543 family)